MVHRAIIENHKYYYSETELKYRKLFIELDSIHVFVKVGVRVVPRNSFLSQQVSVLTSCAPPTFTSRFL